MRCGANDQSPRKTEFACSTLGQIYLHKSKPSRTTVEYFAQATKFYPFSSGGDCDDGDLEDASCTAGN